MIPTVHRGWAARHWSLRLLLASAGIALAAIVAPSASATTDSADVATTVQGPPTRITLGYASYRIAVTNHGPNTAAAVAMSDSWWGGWTGFSSVTGSAPSGVSCSAPPVGSNGAVTCTTPSLAPGATMTVALTIHVRLLFHNQLLSDTANATSPTFDPNTANNTSSWLVIGI